MASGWRAADCGRGLGAGSRSGARGFTLVEVLIVICILGVLMGLLVPTLVGARQRASITAVKTELNQLKAALEAYNSKFGDYPPTSLRALGAKIDAEDVNQGIESVVACLATRKGNGPFFNFPEKQLQNRDGDNALKNLTDWYFGDNQLFEFEDRWGSPYVYLHFVDYEKPDGLNKYVTQTNAEGFEITPVKSKKTKAFLGPASFQLWSLGPDGTNQDCADGSDDIME
jgi:prepilin-type N-terminal cleavage/methylation domain-containing protein